MIEISELAKEALKTITPFLIVGGTEIIKDSASDLWIKIKSVFNKKEDHKLIEEFEKTPTDLATKAKIEDILETELKQNADLVNSLNELISSVQATETYKNIITQIGDNNISVSGKINNSTININK